MKFAQVLIAGWLCAGLLGCGAHDFSDLDAEMQRMRMQAPGEIDATPSIRTSPSFVYAAGGLRSPFQSRASVVAHQGVNRFGADPARRKAYLEGFDIEQFEMVGTLANAAGVFALLRGAGGVHRLMVGDYLGRNHGQVVAISEVQVEVIERVPDGAGAWLERSRVISLKEHV